MTVILSLGPIAAAQGFDNSLPIVVPLTNSGDENVEHLRLKIIDNVVFSKLCIAQEVSPGSVLNVYNTRDIHNYTDNSFVFPAGTTKSIRFNDFDLKATPPIQDHPLKGYWQYLIY